MITARPARCALQVLVLSVWLAAMAAAQTADPPPPPDDRGLPQPAPQQPGQSAAQLNPQPPQGTPVPNRIGPMDPGATAAPSGSQPADPSTGTPGVANPLTPPTLNTGGPPAAGGPPVANHVIGFGLNPSDDAKMRQEAAQMGAQYYPAGNQAQLLNALGTAAGVINQPGAPAGGGDGWTTALIIAGGLLLVTCIGGAIAVLLVVTKSGSARRAPQPVGAPPGPAASSFSLVSDQGAAHPLATGATRIGRNPDCEVCLAHDERVSACHARITLGPGGTLQITDESRNGTLVDGELLLNATRPLRGSETIQIGQSIFRLRQFGPATPY